MRETGGSNQHKGSGHARYKHLAHVCMCQFATLLNSKKTTLNHEALLKTNIRHGLSLTSSSSAVQYPGNHLGNTGTHPPSLALPMYVITLAPVVSTTEIHLHNCFIRCSFVKNKFQFLLGSQDTNKEKTSFLTTSSIHVHQAERDNPTYLLFCVIIISL